MSETWTLTDLVAAGWTEEELAWENLAGLAMRRLAGGDPGEARKTFGEMVMLANAAFAADDPRLGTSLANLGAALVSAGEAGRAGRTIADARRIWRGCDPWVAKMTAPRVAKSSLFHMRMEQRHRPTYEARWREKWGEFVSDARSRIAGEPLLLASPAEAGERLARWTRERPAMLNDTRRLMAASMLLACGES